MHHGSTLGTGHQGKQVQQVVDLLSSLVFPVYELNPPLLLPPHARCSPPRLHAPFSLKRPRSQPGRQKGHVKNLKDLWEKSPELLEAIGAEQLAGSGFEREQPDMEFAMQESSEKGEA